MAERWRPGSFESFLDDKVESYISPIANDIALRSEAARSQTPRELAAALGERYSVGSVIGVGGMATVYLAHDQACGRAVAVKVLHSALADSLGVGRFMQEIEVTARLEHSRIVPVHERGEAAGLLYFVMRYFEAGSLRQHIEREGKLTIPNAISIARDVAQALDYAHGRGVIHRDVKPANILLEGLNAFVADFGISKLVDVAGSGRLTSRGVVVGTPEYMSPEQAEPGGRLDGRSDVYSLGCVVYEMLAGEPPYAATSRRDLLAKHAAAAIPDLSILRPIVTLAMRQSVEKALQKSPADRYRTCGEFVAALESAAREAPPTAPHSSGHESSLMSGAAGGGRSVWARSKQAVWLVTGSMVVLATGISLLPARTKADAIVQSGMPTNIEDIGGMDRRRMVVYPVVGKGAAGEFADALTRQIHDLLRMAGSLQLVSLAGTDSIAASAAYDSVARALQVGTVLAGELQQDRGAWALKLRLIDGASGMALDSSTARGPVGDELRVVTALGRMLSTMVATQVPGARVEQSDIQPKSFQAWRLTAHAEALARELSKGPGDAEWERAIARADSILLEAQRLDPNWIVPTLRRSAISRWRGTSATGRLDQLRWLNASLAQADWVLRTGATGAYASDAYQLRGAARFFIARGDLVSGRAEKNAMLAGAEADLKESTRIAPNNAAAWRGLSTLYAAKPDLPASMRAAAMAYRANPFTLGAQVLDRMYRTAYISEEFDHARDYCDEGRLRFPQDVRFAECRLWLFTVGKKPELGEVWGAVDDLLRLAGKFRREWYRREGHVVAAIALGRHGLADSARGVLRALPDTSAIVDPDHELLYFKAYAYLTLRDRTAALRRLQMILDLHPELREAWASNSPWWWRDISGDEVFRTLLRR